MNAKTETRTLRKGEKAPCNGLLIPWEMVDRALRRFPNTNAEIEEDCAPIRNGAVVLTMTSISHDVHSAKFDRKLKALFAERLNTGDDGKW